MERIPSKTKHPFRSPDFTGSTIRLLEDGRLRDVRGGNGGITA